MSQKGSDDLADSVSEKSVDFDSQTSGAMVFGCSTPQLPKMNWAATVREEQLKEHEFYRCYQIEAEFEDVLVMRTLGQNTPFAETSSVVLMVAQNFVVNRYTDLDFA